MTRTPEEIAAATVLDQWRIPDETDAERVLEQVLDARDGQTAHDILDSIRAAIEADRAQFFDTSGSASSQHFIDTGRYLLHEEVNAPPKCIHCGRPVEWVEDEVLAAWKHSAADEFGRSYFSCHGRRGSGRPFAEAPHDTPHP